MWSGARSGGEIEGDGRRGLRRAIPLERADAETRFECVDHLERQRLGAGGDQRQRGELLRCAARHVESQKRWCGQQDRAVVVAGELADSLGFERSWCDRPSAASLKSGIHIETVRPKAWKNGSMPMSTSVSRMSNAVAHGQAVGRDIAMAEHDALRLASRSGREEHGEELVRVDLVQAQSAHEHIGRQRHALGRGRQLVAFADQPGNIFEDDVLGSLGHFQPFEQLAAGDDVPQARLLDAMIERLARQHEVQIDGDAPVERQRQVGDRASYGRGQHDAHHSLVFAEEVPAQNAAQHQRAHQGFAPGEPGAGRIRQLELAAPLAALFDDLGKQPK